MKSLNVLISPFAIVLILLLISHNSFADYKVARINDPDGYTNIRAGEGKDFAIISTLSEDDLFYCEWKEAEWLKIIAMKFENRKQVIGYVHRSRVQLIETLDNVAKSNLILTVLEKQKNLAESFVEACKSKDSLAYVTAVRPLEAHSDAKYSPILEILPGYFCNTRDTAVLKLFFATMYADRGSASEDISLSIGHCYSCQPTLVLAFLSRVNNKEECSLLFDQIEWGLMNNYSVSEDGKTDNKEYIQLKSRLDTVRNNLCKAE